MREKLTITTPARLHFGLFSVGDVAERKFGGIGLMIDQPQTVVEYSPANQLRISGPSSDDARKAIESWFAKLKPELSSSFGFASIEDLPMHLRIAALPHRHSGFGSGTQLALATAAVAGRSLGLPTQNPEEMASTLERGKRSAIGTYGFCRGGFLVDRGKLENEILAPLDFQSDFPATWDIILLRIKNCVGVSGVQEMSAFENIPPSSEQHRNEMIEMVKNHIIPSVLQQNYHQFSDAVFEFGRRSGLMFKSIQGGAYQNETVANLVNQIREAGVQAVGQSSWGPCVFAITETADQTSELTKHLHGCYGEELEITTTKANNIGSQFQGQPINARAN